MVPNSLITNARVEDLQPSSSKRKWGYVNNKGEFVIAPKYFAVEPFKESLALVVTRGPWQPLGSAYGEFRLAKVTYIDRAGHEIVPPLSVRRARGFSNGRALVVPDSVRRSGGGCAKGGYLDANGQWAIKPQFDDLRDFSEGLAAVNLGAKCGMGGQWGYIDRDGRVGIPLKFRFAGQFHNGRACVIETGHAEKVIDRDGKLLSAEKCP